MNCIDRFFSLPSSQEPLEQRLAQARQAIAGASRVVIGAGAGFSAAAGLVYDGEVFDRRFADFIGKYGFTDLYSSGFFPFPCQEEKWAYWARHIAMCRWEPGAMPLYRQLLALVQDKDYFVITTNVDAQFQKAGFDPARIFATQGDYGYLQCAKGCHDAIYANGQLVSEMLAHTHDCRIPSNLVPRCPVCGGRMEPHLRCDEHFVQNQDWHDACERYRQFMQLTATGKTVLLELGVGFNTPGIIRFPFERLASQNPGVTLIRVNRDHPARQLGMKHFIPFVEDCPQVIQQLQQRP